jgi:hypothetical protein
VAGEGRSSGEVEEVAAAAGRGRRVGVEERLQKNPSPEPFPLLYGNKPLGADNPAPEGGLSGPY